MISRRAAFTLLELAIVMVIIALLGAAVIAGRSMLRNAAISSTMGEFGEYTGAFQQFREKYGALPGDIPNATSFWAGGTVTCPWSNSTGVATCNGNGNQQIADQATYTSYRYEAHRAWQQLAFAGLVEGGFNGGFESSGTVGVTPGTRVPKNALKDNIGWHVYFVGPISSDSAARFFDGNYGHVLYLGAAVFQVAASSKGVVSGEEMAALDAKYDDGSPATGNIRHGAYNSGTGYFGSSCVTAANNAPESAVYAADASVQDCVPLFVTGF